MKAKDIGQSRLVLSARGYTKKVNVKVIAKVTGISGVDDTVWVEIDGSEKLSPKLSPSKFAGEKITYGIKDSEIAKIDSSGKITPKKEGKTKITISAGGCTKTITLEVYRYVESQVTYTPPATNYYNNNSGSSAGSSSGSSSSGDSGSDSRYFENDDDEFF